MTFTATFYLLLSSFLGISIVKFVPLSLSRIQRFIVGPSLGIILVTQITFIIALLFSFSLFSITLGLLVSIIFVFLLHFVKIPQSTPPHPANRRTNWSYLLITFFIIINSLSIYIFSTKVLAPSENGLTTGNGGLYADTAMHSAFTMSLVERGLPPVNPLFAGQPLIYPFMVNFTGAILVKLGTTLHSAFMIPQVMHFFAFTLLFCLLGLRLLGDRGAFFALAIFLFGWGLGFIDYFRKALEGSIWSVTQEFTNNFGLHHLHNVLTGLIFPERSFLPGLVLGLLITVIVISRLNDMSTKTNAQLFTNHYSLITGILLGILPLWHTHTFLFFGLAIGVWIFFSSIDANFRILNIFNTSNFKFQISNFQTSFTKFLTVMKTIGLIYGIALIIALPSLWWFSQHLSHETFLRFRFGWMNSSEDLLTFWWSNSGLLLPLALIGTLQMPRRLKLYILPGWIIFFVVNFIQFQPWDWDNIKLLSWSFLFLTLAASYTLTGISRKKLSAFIVLPVFLSLIGSGILSVIYQGTSVYTIYDKHSIDLAEWVKENTDPQSVFLVDPWPNHPIPGLSGRSVYMGYPGQLWVHGIDYYKRESEIKAVLSGNTTIITNLDIPIGYIVVPSQQKQQFISPNLTLVYENAQFGVFEVKN